MKIKYVPLSPRLAGATVYVTAAVNNRMKENHAFRLDVITALIRFQSLDWGDTCATDVQTNKACYETGDRLFAVYHTCAGRVYIIADAVPQGQPYETITVLYPSEY